MMQSRSAMAPFLLVVSLVGLVGILAVNPAMLAKPFINIPSTSHQTGEMTWQLESVETIPPAVSRTALLDGSQQSGMRDYSGWNMISPDSMPEPPQNGCEKVQRLTGKPCAVEIYQAPGSAVGGRIIHVVVKSGSQVVATLKLFESTYHVLGDDFALCFESGFCAGTTRVWLGTIEVARGLWRFGFGRYMYDLSNYLARINTPASEPVVRYFSDTAGWGPSVIQNTGWVLQVGTEYLYLIPSVP